MYLTLHRPDIVAQLARWGTGLWATPLGLIIKSSKEAILAVKVRSGFAFYLAPVTVGGVASYVLLTAFFDNEREPLVCRTGLYKDDASTSALLDVLTTGTLNAYFFNELDEELLSVEVAGNASVIQERLAQVDLLDIKDHREALDQAGHWFALRTAEDDAAAIQMRIVEELFPSDLVIMDIEIERHQFHGSESFSSTSLEREEPGAYQERDIVFLFQRVFSQERIYLNPVKWVDGEEFVDVLVVGEQCAYLIQAKDSPNTERVLRNTIERKRIKSINQVQHGANQLKGAFAFVAENPKLDLKMRGTRMPVDLTDMPLLGIIVVKELFNDSMQEYSEILFELMDKVENYCLAFDFAELGLMTLHCPSEERYLGAVWQIIEGMKEHGELPRLRYSGQPPA